MTTMRMKVQHPTKHNHPPYLILNYTILCTKRYVFIIVVLEASMPSLKCCMQITFLTHGQVQNVKIL
jgi:hypothetical protein